MKDYKDRNNYLYGNVAYDFEPEVQNDNEVNKYDFKIQKVRGLSKKNPLTDVGRILLGLSATGLIVCFLALLVQYVTITYNQKTITNLKNEVRVIEDEIYNVDVQTAETLDLANIKKIAIGKLGMVVPADNQVMYINVPNEDYTVNY